MKEFECSAAGERLVTGFLVPTFATADPGRTGAAVIFGGSLAALTYLVIEAGSAGHEKAVCDVLSPGGNLACPVAQ